MATVSAGVPFLDRYSGGFQTGDNVVWAAEAGTFPHAFVSAFVQDVRTDPKKTLIYVNSNYAPQNIHRRFSGLDPSCTFVLVDAFTYGKGKGDSVFRSYYETGDPAEGFRSICIEDPSDVEAFGRILSTVEEEYGEGIRYVFDSLTGLAELWGGDRPVQEFFTHQCPKLYELQTVAYWLLEREAHSGPFLANLSHITQVVIQLRCLEQGACEIKFLKGEDRPSRILHGALRYRVTDGEVEFLDRMPGRDLHIGERIRQLRGEQGLSQAELARKLGVTPSALCQIENNQVHPSLPLLLDMSRLLDCALDRIVPGEVPERESRGGWLVHKKKDQIAPGPKGSQKGPVEIRPLLPDPEDLSLRIRPCLPRLRPGSAGERSFFDHKGPEFGWVLNGILRVVVERQEILLRKGDSLFLEHETIRRWKNEGRGAVELLWVLA